MSTRDTDIKHLRVVVAGHLRGAAGQLVLAALCLAGVIAMELLTPWPLKVVFDHVLLDKPLTPGLSFLAPLLALGPTVALPVLAGSVVVIALLSGVFAYGQIYITSKIGHQLTYELRRELFARLTHFPLAFHRRSRSGELLMKVASDTAALRELFTDWVLTTASHTLLVLGMLLVMFLLNWQLSLVVLSTLPVLGLVLYALNRRISSTVMRQRKQEGKMATRFNEVLGAIAVVQAFGRQTYEAQRFDEESAQNVHEAVRTARATAAVARTISVMSALSLAATLLVGAWQVLQGRMLPGDLLVFVSYVRSLFKPVRNLGKMSAKLSRSLVSAKRIDEILAVKPGAADRPNAVSASALRGEIAFEDVSFAYADHPPVLERASFRIRAGERVALIGPSGSGKSTIVNLILRLYDASEGVVRIDDLAIDGYRRESLRHEIGIVLQDALLFGASIRENIAYGKPDATSEEIEWAAREAHAHAFISALPSGYETIIGERGATLSGGQRQRICLARALLKRPSILILDEPLAGVDAESAALIDETLSRVQHGKTTIVIAHDLNNLGGFDRVLLVKDRRVSEIDIGGSGALARQQPLGLAMSHA